MDSLGNGREGFIQYFGGIYDQMNRDRSNNEDCVQINREELQLLRDNSCQVDKLSEHNLRLLDELERCRAASARVEGLEKENQRLAGELEHALKQQISVSPMAPGPSSEPFPTTKSERNTSDEIIHANYRKLVPKYNALATNYKLMKEAKSKLEGIRESDKLKLQRWNAFKDEQVKKVAKRDERIMRQREEIQRLQSQLSAFPCEVELALIAETDPPLPAHLIDVQTPRTSLDSSRIAEIAGDVQDREEREVLLPDHRNNLEFHTTVQDTELDIEIRHSSSTDSDPIAEDQLESKGIKQEQYSSPNSIVIISARAVRKTKKGENTQPRNIVKNEDLGRSSPLGLALHNFHDSIDLDDIGERVDTPRKRKRALELSRRASALTSSSPISSRSRSHSQHHSGSTEAIELPSDKPPTIRKSSVLQPRSVNTPILPRTSDNRAYKKSRIADNKAVSSVPEDGDFSNLDSTTENHNFGRLQNLPSSPSPKKHAVSLIQPAASVSHVRSVRTLAPSRLANEVGRDISPVKAYIAPCVPSSGLSKRGSSVGPTIHSKSPIKAAAGLGRPVSRGTLRVSALLEMPTSRERLDKSREPSTFLEFLKNGTSTAAKGSPRLNAFFNSKPITTTPLKSISYENASSLKATPVTSWRDLIDRSAPPSRKQHFRLSPDGTEELDVQPEHEPLRLRPIQSLTVGDFKINPNYNQGYGYAFTEVVRGKDARRCIQGCVKPECCGFKLRALVAGTRDPNKPLTASQEEEDTNILEEFMGRDAYKIQNMSKGERDEMVLQAKTREYANKHGKHRHAFEKPSSPPGFWRADWPSTQEEIADRAKAREKDRNVVEERYREATRKGGRFVFRDE